MTFCSKNKASSKLLGKPSIIIDCSGDSIILLIKMDTKISVLIGSLLSMNFLASWPKFVFDFISFFIISSIYIFEYLNSLDIFSH